MREEAKILKQQGKAKRPEIFQDQILGEGYYSDPQDQALYDKQTLSPCSTEALNAWDRIQKLEKKTELQLGLNIIRENSLVTFCKD